MDETIKILCVDDEPGVLKALKRVFLDENYTILTAQSAKEGFEALEKELIQLVISDYRMPILNGVDFLREVRNKWPDTVRIVLSGYADTASIVGAINDGQVYKFIPKPWNDEELRITIANSIERYRLVKKSAALTDLLLKRNQELDQLNLELQALLEEKSSFLKMKSEVLFSYQNLLDCVPVAIIGINEDGIIVSCNSTWAAIALNGIYPIGRDARECLPESLVELSKAVRNGGTKQIQFSFHGYEGIMTGRVTKNNGGSKTIVLTFLNNEGVI